MIFQTRKPPVGWLSEVRSVAPPEPNLMSKPDNNTNPKPDEQQQMLELEDVYEDNNTRSMEEVE